LYWRKPKDYVTVDYKVFEDVIEPSDIKQGALGDCWFLCALASLAEFPPLIRKLFINGSDCVNSAGVYSLRFCKNGQWTDVIIDEFFPCILDGGPAYSKCHGNEIWVQLVEKAFAKLHGSYNLIRSGLVYEAMIDLTGAPYEKIYFSDDLVQEMIVDGSLFKKLIENDMEGNIMSLSTPGEDHFTEGDRSIIKTNEEGHLDSGLVPGHAYSLIAVKEPKSGPPGLKLVQIRNPWGYGEWYGDWGDKSELWTNALRDELNAKIEDDGTFWMSYEDVTKHFDSLNICICRGGMKTWEESRLKVTFNFIKNVDEVRISMFEFTVHQSGIYYFSLHQKDERIAGQEKYIDIGIAVMKLDSSGRSELVNATANAVERQVQLKLVLSPGNYVVVPTSSGCRFQNHLSYS
jgi:calpain-15